MIKITFYKYLNIFPSLELTLYMKLGPLPKQSQHHFFFFDLQKNFEVIIRGLGSGGGGYWIPIDRALSYFVSLLPFFLFSSRVSASNATSLGRAWNIWFWFEDSEKQGKKQFLRLNGHKYYARYRNKSPKAILFLCHYHVMEDDSIILYKNGRPMPTKL